jgi:SNF2 family DNA or RNA helicase
MIRVIRDRRLYGLVSSHYNEALRTIAKETPGMSWLPSNRAWVGYSDAAAVAVKRLREAGHVVHGDVDTANGIATLPIALEGLYSYQKEAVEFAVAHAEEGCLIALDTALGKSAVATRVVRTFKGKTVVVCPSFVKSVWGVSAPDRKCEIEKWWPKAKWGLLATTKPKEIDQTFDMVVIHYDVLHAWVSALIEWGATDFIADECHALMTATTRRTKAATALSRACKRRLGLSATPMTSRPRDLWALVETISEGRFGSRFWAYGKRYCDGRQEQVTPTKVVWKFDGASNLDELNARLKHFMFRRTKTDVAHELPPVTDQIIELEVAKGCLISPTAALRSDRILRQALDLAADGKIPQCIDMVANYIEQGSKVVVFSYRKAIAHAIAEGVAAKLPVKVRVVTGDVHHDKRRAIVDEQPDLLCATMDSLGVGVSLAYADVGFFAELHYVPSVMRQCRGRLPRPDSKTAKLIVYACARGTADDLIRRTILKKMSNEKIAIGEAADGLLESLDKKKDNAAILRALYERMVRDDE